MYCWYLLLLAVLVLSHPSASERFHGRQCSERFCEDLPDARLFRSFKDEANHKRYISRGPDIRVSRQKSTRDSVTVRRSPEVDLLKFRGDAKKFEDERFDGQLRSRYDADNYDRYASRDYEIVRRELIKDPIRKNNNRRETYTRALVSDNAKQRFTNERSATASRDSRKPIRDGNAMFEGTEENGNIYISSLRTDNDMNNLESRRVKEESERRQVRSQLEFIRQRNTEAELHFIRGNNNRERTNIRDINAVRSAGADENRRVKGLRNSLDRTTDFDHNDNRRIKQNRRLRQTSDVIDSSSERRQIHALRYQNERFNPNSEIRNDFDDKTRDRRPNVMRIRTVTVIRENTQARNLNNLRTGDFLFWVPTVHSDATSVRERRQFRSSAEPVALRRISYPFSALQQVTFANRISAGHSEETPQTRTLREISRHTNKNSWDTRSDSDRKNIRRESRASYYRKEQRNTERYFSGPTVENNGLRSTTEYKIRSDSILRLPTELYESVMNLNRRNVRDISKRDVSQRSERQFSRTSVLSTETRHLFANMQRGDSTRALSRFSSEGRSLRSDLIRLYDKRRSSHLVNTRFERITRIFTDRNNDRSIDSRISRTPSDVTRQVSTERQPSIVQMERSDLRRNRERASRDLTKLGQRYEIRPVNSGFNFRLLAKDQSQNRQLRDSVDRVDVRRSINNKDDRFTITRRDTQLNYKRQHLPPTVRAFTIERSVRKDSQGNTDTATTVTRLSRRMDYDDIRRQKQYENTQAIREVFERKHGVEFNSDLTLERLNRRSYERENSRLLKQRLITRSFDLQRTNVPRYDTGHRQVRPTTERTDDLRRISRDVSQRGLEFRQLNFRSDAEVLSIRDNMGRDRSQKVSTRTYCNKQEISHGNRLYGLATERREARRSMDRGDIKSIRIVRLDSRTSDVRTEGTNIRENILRNANRITEIRSHRRNMDRRFDRDLRHDAEMSDRKTERKDIRQSVVRKLLNGDVTPTENRVFLTSAIRRDFDKRIMDHDQYESITDNVLSWKYLILLVQGIYICGILLQIGAGDSSSKFNGRYLALWTPTYHVKLN